MSPSLFALHPTSTIRQRSVAAHRILFDCPTNNGAGALVEDERHGLNFVAYLRDCFVRGGFPGLAREPGGLPDVILKLARNLRPF